MKRVMILVGIFLFATFIFAEEGINRIETSKVKIRGIKTKTLNEGTYELGVRKNGGNWNVLKTDLTHEEEELGQDPKDFKGIVPEGKKWQITITLIGREVDE